MTSTINVDTQLWPLLGQVIMGLDSFLASLSQRIMHRNCCHCCQLLLDPVEFFSHYGCYHGWLRVICDGHIFLMYLFIFCSALFCGSMHPYSVCYLCCTSHLLIQSWVVSTIGCTFHYTVYWLPTYLVLLYGIDTTE